MKLLSRLGAALLGVAALGLMAVAVAPRPPVRTKTIRRQAEPGDVQLSGEKARAWLAQSDDGKSLAEALTAARFGLEWKDSTPENGTTAGGYLGLSHDQNLKAWFGSDGVTVQPTMPEAERRQTWSMALHLKSYGHGGDLLDAPPIVSRKVKSNRVEYERASSNPQSAIRDPQLIEWYENRAEGIEQGFTLNERPARSEPNDPNESLRLLLAVSGDLHAQVAQDGNQIELTDAKGKRTLSYRNLIAQDAEGKKLAARMEVSAEGREIALVVEDAGARYPIVIDPSIASLEQKLRSDIPQLDARFGFAVAIEGDLAVVGAWREDVGANADVGAVYVFVRTGAFPNSSWALDKRFGSASGAGQQCGWSVAISGNRIAFGCPGDNGGAGTAFYFQRNGPGNYSGSAVAPGGVVAGDLFGNSIAINGNMILVGAPGAHYSSTPNAGQAWISKINPDGTTSTLVLQTENVANNRLGTAVALDSTFPNQYTAIIGKPGVGTGAVLIAEFDSGGVFHSVTVTPPGGHAGDNFGNSVALSGHPGANTAVIGAWGDDTKGNDAGAAYVFERVQTTLDWNFQQKLTAFDGVANDFFSASAVAIQGDTILVGAYSWDAPGDPNGDNDERGAAYVFTRNGTVWTQQSQILAADSNSGDNFGVSVGLSGDTAIIGARHATAAGTAAAGAAYVYRLPHTLANIATRLRVETGDNALIAGFIVTGPGPTLKNVIVRAIGPSLPLADKLADPTLELYQGNVRLDANDNWVDLPTSYKQLITAYGLDPANDLESVIFAQLQANSTQYTAVVRGVNNGTGIGVVEVYDLGPAGAEVLANISTRGLVQTGDNVLFAGTIVTGAASQKVIIRGLGPSVPVVGRMSDPTLELHDGNGALLEANDNWVDSPNKQAIIDTGIPPNHDLESAIVRTLSPGNYTAILRGFGGTTGIAVVEVYALN